MKKKARPSPEKKVVDKLSKVEISSVIQTTDDGQVTLIKLALDKNDLTLSEEQSVDLCYQLAGMLPNSLKAQLAAQLVQALGETFR